MVTLAKFVLCRINVIISQLGQIFRWSQRVPSVSSFMSFYLQKGAGAGSSRLWTLRSSADGPAADADELVQLFVGLAQTLLHLGEALPELVELRLHRAQQLPDLAGALLDGKGLEAHLQAVQQAAWCWGLPR